MENSLERAVPPQVREACRRLGIPYLALGDVPRLEVARLLPQDVARQYRAVPVAQEDGRLTVAMAEPHRPDLVERLAAMLGQPIFPVLSAAEEIDVALARLAALPAGVPEGQLAS
jgi:type II secretory ATPase GspE/PulE/Tfp pilus assembly ATPase PilB-like protein